MTLLGSGRSLALIGSITHRGDTQQFEAANALLDQPSYELYDAGLMWTSNDRRYQVGLHGRNLGDEECKIADYNFPTLGGGTVTAFYGNPRRIFGSVSVRF